MALIWAAMPASALAAGWTAPTAIQPSSPSTAGTANARLTVNARGDQVVKWDDMQDMGSDADQCEHSEVATRVAGGAWSASTVVPCDAKIALGSGGNAMAFWSEGTSAKAATAQAGSSFGAAVIADSATSTHDGLTGAVDAQGVPTIAWTVGTYGTSKVHAKTASAAGTWLPAATPETVAGIAAGRAYGYPALAIGPQGDAVIAVTSTTSPSATPYLFQAYSRPASPHTWTPADLIPSAAQTQLGSPAVIFDAQGRPTVVVMSGWTTFGLSAWSRAAGAGSSWSAKQTVESGTSCCPAFAMAVDSTGLVQLGWFYSSGGTRYVRAAMRSGGSTTWSTPANLVPSGCGTTYSEAAPSVTIDSADNALIGFTCGGTEYTFQRAAGSAAYVPFSKPAGATSVEYATDPNGYTIATWADGGTVYTSVYDPVAPAVDSFNPTAAAVAGQPVSFDAAGSDLWGPVTYSVDFGDGQPPATGRAATTLRTGLARATTASTVTHTYAAPGDYTATITVTDGAANSVQSSVPVSVAPGAGAAQAPVTPPPSNLAPPVLGESINVYVLKKPVSIKLPGQTRFQPLNGNAHLPNGTVIDTRKGRVMVVIADGTGDTDAAEFYEGLFEVNQPKKLKGLANIFLNGGGFKGCPKAPRNPHAQVSALSKRRSVRHLWGKGSGKFRTVGRFSSATVRGTTWLTDDRCDGTVTKVRVGKVAVRDFVKRKTVVVSAGKSYFARAGRR